MLLIASRKQAKTAMVCLLVIFGFSLQAFSQCPTINNPNPVICDASGLTISNLDAYANDLGGGISWWDSPTGGFQYVDTQLLSQLTYYADDDIGSCALRSSVTVDFTVDPSGQTLDGIYCDIDGATVQTYIDEVLTPIAPVGGSVLVYTDFALTTLANPATVLTGATNYYIVFVDNGGCEGQLEFGSTAIFASAATPTPPTLQIFCSANAPTVGDLNSGSAGAVSWYDDIDTNGDPIPPALLPATLLIDGNTYYVQVDDVFCPSQVVAVLVQIDLPVDVGTSAVLDYCEDAVPTTDFDLFLELGGMPTTGGTWTGPLPTSNGHLGTVNISTLTAGTYVFTYTAVSTGVCPDGSSTVTIVIHENLSSGSPSPLSPISFCVVNLPTNFDLFSLLINEDPNGVWTIGTTGTGTVVTSPIDLTGFPPGTYDYTYTQNGGANPCPDNMTTVQIIILVEPNPGVAINAQFCENDLAANSPYDLFAALDGTQDNNTGTWTDGNGLAVINPIDITGFTIAGSPYTFTYTLSNGTCEASEIITITILPAPDTGVALAPITFCEDEVAANSPFDLFTMLDGSQDPNGTWYVGTDTTGAVATNPIDLTILGTGVFNYTYSIPNIGTCSDAPVTVQITINPLPNPGVAINAIFCEDDLAANSPFDLFAALDGSQDNNLGIWTDSNGIEVTNPIDITGFTIAGSPYTFTYTIDNGICDASEIVTITIVPSPDSGVALAPIEFCADDVAANSPFDLFTMLDGSQDLNGTWYVGTDTTGAVAFNPIDLTILGTGVFNYTYSVPNIGTCSDAPVTVQITINPLPNPGVAINAIFCEDDLAANSPFDLFTALDGSQDNNLGVWTDSNGNVVINPIDITGFTIAGSPYTFTYTIDNGICDASEIVTISVVPSPDTGVALAPIEFCADDVAANSPFDLFTMLDGSQDPNGTWYVGTDTTGAIATNPIDLTILGTGVFNYTYSVPNIGTCSDAPVTVQITINPLPNPGVAINAIFCENDLAANSPFDLFDALDGSQDNNLGIWTNAGGDVVANPIDITGFTIAGSPYTFIYTIDNGICDASEIVTISVVPAPDTGVALAPIAFCEEDVPANSPFDLFTMLDGSQDPNGTWYVGTDTTGPVATNPIDLTILGTGVFNYTYSVPNIGTCSDAPVTIQITINPMPVTGTATPFVVCVDDLAANSPFDLFGQLVGNDIGGTWSDDDATGALTGSDVDLTLLVVGTYNFTYSITSNDGCTNSTTVVITVTEAANAGTATNAA